MVHIIILTYNKIEITKKCLEYLKNNTSCENWRVIIVDNGSKDGTVEYLEKIRETYPKKISLIKNETNLGYAKGCNIGARDITDGYLLFLNNDVFVLPNWLQNMINCMKKEKERAIVGAKLIFPETQRIQHAGVIIEPNGHPDHQYRNFKSDHPKVNIERSYPAVTGACLLIKTAIFRAVKGFDEQYILGSFEDVDLCLKIFHLGYKIIYCPTAVGIHHEKASSHQIPYYESAIIPKNLERFLKKWFPTIAANNRLLNIYNSFFKTNIKAICKKLHIPQTLLNFFVKMKEKFFIINNSLKLFRNFIEKSPPDRGD